MDFGVVVGWRIRVRYLWDTEKKLDWTCTNTSIVLIVLDKVKKKLKRTLDYIDFYGQELKKKSVENKAN